MIIIEELTNYWKSKGLEESKKVIRQGRNVAIAALKELEAKTGKKVVTTLIAKDALILNKPRKIKGAR